MLMYMQSAHLVWQKYTSGSDVLCVPVESRKCCPSSEHIHFVLGN